ncbi:hypothetical protein DSECCO2_502000 [anaerobic digester metagenome]
MSSQGLIISFPILSQQIRLIGFLFPRSRTLPMASLRLSSMSPSGFRLAEDTLPSANGWRLQTPIVDFHHQVNYHARHTIKNAAFQ